MRNKNEKKVYIMRIAVLSLIICGTSSLYSTIHTDENGHMKITDETVQGELTGVGDTKGIRTTFNSKINKNGTILLHDSHANKGINGTGRTIITSTTSTPPKTSYVEQLIRAGYTEINNSYVGSIHNDGNVWLERSHIPKIAKILGFLNASHCKGKSYSIFGDTFLYDTNITSLTVNNCQKQRALFDFIYRQVGSTRGGHQVNLIDCTASSIDIYNTDIDISSPYIWNPKRPSQNQDVTVTFTGGVTNKNIVRTNNPNCITVNNGTIQTIEQPEHE